VTANDSGKLGLLAGGWDAREQADGFGLGQFEAAGGFQGEALGEPEPDKRLGGDEGGAQPDGAGPFRGDTIEDGLVERGPGAAAEGRRGGHDQSHIIPGQDRRFDEGDQVRAAAGFDVIETAVGDQKQHCRPPLYRAQEFVSRPHDDGST
jgi:hypothetical protein